MLLTITTTHEPATDLGYLLAKNPRRAQAFPLAFGTAHVFYPTAEPTKCTAALLLQVDPVSLSRRRGSRRDAVPLAPYVNDRPYVASSFLSVAIAQVFGSALKGRCRERSELAERTLPLCVELCVVPCRGGASFLRALFEPLGYTVEATSHPLDETFPSWGDSRYFTVRLTAEVRLAELLSHLYVLLPVLDDAKHYWVGEDEVDKLLRAGEGWLERHPARDEIAHRYLKRRRSLVSEALRRLTETDDLESDDGEDEPGSEETKLEKPISLNETRMVTVVRVLEEEGARRVLDLGCGEGKLLGRLLKSKVFTHIRGSDVSTSALEIAASRLRLDELPERQRARIALFQGSATYRDSRFSGFDALCAVEVVEHIEPSRLDAFERVVFEHARPRLVVLTTPNVEYNVRFDGLASGKFRHRDHRFEWSRAQFVEWAERVAERFGYVVRFEPIGVIDDDLGSPTQMALFSRSDGERRVVP